MTGKRLLLLVVGLLGAFALVAAGCGGGNEESSGGAGTGGGETGTAANQTMTIGWGAEPPSLDPGLATDTTSSNVLLNIMDPLVRLNPDTLEAVPSLAESWDVSSDGKTVTFHLRQDGKWTNGDPVTASDFVYSWKRTLSPELAADYAYQLYGIEGAQEYNACQKNCDALADKVGVSAPDDYTLVVKLTSPQPWFIQQASHHSFLAVNQSAVEQFGDKWTEPENIVTDGPFKLAKWEHDAEIDLVKNDDWRDAADVSLTSVPGKIIVDGTTRVQAFESGEIDTLDGGGLPPDEIARLKDTPEYESYPALGTYYYGFNIKNISDIHERRALSLAVNRQEIIDQIAQADQIPATGMSPQGISGFDTINPELALDARSWGPRPGEGRAVAGRESEDGHQPVLQRLARPQGDRHCCAGAVEGARDQHHSEAAGVGAVPRVPRPAAERCGGRVSPRMDLRLSGRDQRARSLDVRLRQQQHELLRQEL